MIKIRGQVYSSKNGRRRRRERNTGHGLLSLRSKRTCPLWTFFVLGSSEQQQQQQTPPPPIRPDPSQMNTFTSRTRGILAHVFDIPITDTPIYRFRSLPVALILGRDLARRIPLTMLPSLTDRGTPITNNNQCRHKISCSMHLNLLSQKII